MYGKILLMAALPWFCAAAQAFQHPGGLYSQEHLALVRRQVQQNAEPWKGAYGLLKSDADAALATGLHAAAVLDVPGYYSEPDSHRAASERLCTDAYAAYACALVYRLGITAGAETYAARARQVLNAWAAVNTGVSGFDGPLLFSNTAVAFVFAAELLAGYGGWSAPERNAFAAWVRDVYRPVTGAVAGDMVANPTNNWGSWGTMATLAASYYLNDTAAVYDMAELVRERIGESIAPDGHMPAETGRGANGIWYTYFSLAPLTQACWIAYNAVETDLFGYVPPDGAGLQKALDFLMYYCRNVSEWPFYDGTPSRPNRDDWPANLFEAMYGVYRIPEYGSWADGYRPLGKMRHTSMGWTFSTLMRPPDRVALNPPPGTYADRVAITAGAPASGAQVRYTTDGTEPAASSPLFAGPVTLTRSGYLWVKTFGGAAGVSVDKKRYYTIVPDTKPPAVTAAVPLPDGSGVQVWFDEPVDTVGAAEHGRYALSGGITVTAAVPEPGGTRVTLAVSAPLPDGAYTLAVNGIRDRAVTPNTLADGRFAFSARPGLYDDFEHGGRLAWSARTAARWQTVPGGSSGHALFLNTSQYLPERGCPGEFTLAEGASFTTFSLSVMARTPENSINMQADYGVVFGYMDPDNYCFLRVSWEPGYSALYRVANGSRGLVTGFGAPLLALRDKGYHRVQVEQGPQTVRVLFDGELKGEAPLVPAGPGRTGLCSYDDMAYFDDFLVTAPDGASGIASGAPPARTVRLSVWPNPVRTHASIRLGPGAGAREVTLYDRSGTAVVRWLNVPPERTVAWDGTGSNGRALPPGLYCLAVAENGGAPVRTVPVLVQGAEAVK